MGSDWKVERLGDVAEVLLSNVDKKSKPDEPPVRLCNYMDVYKNTVITNGIPFMQATATPEQIIKYSLRRGDVMITKDSEDPKDIAVPSCVVEEFDEPVLCGYHLALLRPVRIDGAYLAYALRSTEVNQQFVRRANGSTRFGLTVGVISDAQIPVPPLPEQKKIAQILSSVDEAIQATQAVIHQTRRVKKALLQTLLTRGLGHTRFKQTEIGEIPESWSVEKVGSVCNIQNNARLPIKSEVRAMMHGDYPYWGPTKVLSHINEYRYEGNFALIGEDGDHFLKFDTWEMTQWATGKFNVNNHAHVIASSDECSARWFYYYFMHRDLFSTGFLTRQGAGRYKLTRASLEQLRIALPPAAEQHQIIKVLNQLRDSILSMEKTLAQASVFKSALLQTLLSGQTRVTP